MQAVNHICLCLSCLSFAIYEYKKMWNKKLERPIDSNVIASVCMRTGRLEVNQLVKYMFDSQRCAALKEKRLLKLTPGWTQAPNPPNNSMHLDARTTRWHYSIRSLLRTEEFMKIKHAHFHALIFTHKHSQTRSCLSLFPVYRWGEVFLCSKYIQIVLCQFPSENSHIC